MSVFSLSVAALATQVLYTIAFIADQCLSSLEGLYLSIRFRVIFALFL